MRQPKSPGFFPPTPQYPREKKRRALGRCAWRVRQGSTALRLSPIGAPATLAPSPRLSSARWGAPSHAKRKASVRLPEFYFFTAKLDPSVRHPSPIFSVQNTKLSKRQPKSSFFSANLDRSVMQPKSPLHSSARRSRADGRVLRAQRARRGCRDCPKNKHSSARRSRADGRVYFSESEAVKNERECRVGGLRGDRETRKGKAHVYSWAFPKVPRDIAPV